MSNKILGILLLAGLLSVSVLLLNCGSSSSRPSGVLYVASQGENTVGSYAIDLDNGNLSKINTTAPTDISPTSAVLSPSGNVIYVLNPGSSKISAFTANANGTASAAGTTSVDCGLPANDPCPLPNPVAMARDSAGAFLFVVSQGSFPSPSNCPRDPVAGVPNDECPAISVFATTSGSSSLTLVGGKPVRLSKIPTSIASIADSKGNTFLYVTNTTNLAGTTDNTLSQFLVSSTGTLTPEENNGPYLTASTPTAVLAVHTTPVGANGGIFLYITNAMTNNVNTYQLCTAISTVCTQQSDIDHFFLNQVGPPVALAGTNPVALAVDPTNNFLYIVDHDSADVRGFRISPTTGGLSELSSAVMATGLGPVALAIHPTGKFLFVSNNGASSVSGFNMDPTTGTLSQPIIVTSSANPYGMVAK